MVLGGTCSRFETRVVVIEGNLIAQRYINTVLEPFVRQPSYVFNNNARCQVTQQAIDYIHNIDTLPCPLQFRCLADRAYMYMGDACLCILTNRICMNRKNPLLWHST